MARTPVTVKGGEVKTPLGDAPIIPVLGLMIGGYLAWFGIHYWRRDVKWPTDPIKSVLTGSGLPPSGTAPASATAVLTAEVQALQPDTGGGSGGSTQTGSGPTPVVKGTYTHAELMTLWTDHGGAKDRAQNAACHAIQESSGRADATSQNPDGGTNVGLWQLDTKGVGAGYTIEQLKDPGTNVRLTILGTVNGTNWSQWATPGC